MTGQGILTAGITFGGFKWTGDFTTIDLIAASTNALNGALLARRPDHYRNFTVVGILLMALLGGIGGGVTRDVLLNKIPGAFTNPAYILLCLAAGIVGYLSVSLLGAVESAYASVKQLGSALANGDTLAVLLRFRSGGHSLISAILATPFDGRFAVYTSNATNLVPGDTNGVTDVFVRTQ